MWASTCNEGMFYVMLRNCVSFRKRFTDLNRRVIFLGIRFTRSMAVVVWKMGQREACREAVVLTRVKSNDTLDSGAAMGVELLRQREGLAGRLVSCVAATQVGVGTRGGGSFDGVVLKLVKGDLYAETFVAVKCTNGHAARGTGYEFGPHERRLT